MASCETMIPASTSAFCWVIRPARVEGAVAPARASGAKTIGCLYFAYTSAPSVSSLESCIGLTGFMNPRSGGFFMTSS